MNEPKTTDMVNETRISRVLEYISRHYREELPLSKLADVANLAPTSLCHIVKDCTGRTVSDFITEARIKHATDKLLQTDDEVREIAFECGYNTLTNFNRRFKKLMGCTPTELRERQRKESK